MLLSMNVIEIFASIDGEGKRQGCLTTFLRLHDCNIRCSYCDTLYSYGPQSTFESMSIRAVADIIEQLGNHRITITGGEPLLQEQAIIELIDELTKRNPQYDFNIETNGTIVPSFQRENVWFTYDYKTPSSLAEDSMNLDIFKMATAEDIIKFVVGSVQDLDRMDEVLKTYPTNGQIFVSPVWGNIEGAMIVGYMKAHNWQNVKFQLQIHKFIWDPGAKGV